MIYSFGKLLPELDTRPPCSCRQLPVP